MESKNTIALVLSIISVCIIIVLGGIMIVTNRDQNEKIDRLLEKSEPQPSVIPKRDDSNTTMDKEQVGKPSPTASLKARDSFYITKNKQYQLEVPFGYTAVENGLDEGNTLYILDEEGLKFYKDYEEKKDTLGDHGLPTYGIDISYRTTQETVKEQEVADSSIGDIQSDTNVTIGKHVVRKVVLKDDAITYGGWKNVYYFKVGDDLFSIYVTDDHVQIIESLIASIEKKS